MALQGSGTISFNNINTEMTRTATASLDLNDSEFRFMVQASSGQISMSNAYGKSWATDSWTTAGTENLLDTVGIDGKGEAVSTGFKEFFLTINAYAAADIINGPNGTQYADYVYSTGATSLILRGYVNYESNGPLYCSVYAKTNTTDVFTLNCYYDDGVEYNTTFNLTSRAITGNTSGAGMQRATSGATPWYRCWQVIPFTSGRVNVNYRLWPAGRNDGVSKNGLGCWFWGGQINTGSVKNFYAPFGTSGH